MQEFELQVVGVAAELVFEVNEHAQQPPVHGIHDNLFALKT